MDYQRIYSAFIADRRTAESALEMLGGYSEKHHILPRSLGGADTPDNLIRLTPEDHFFAHLLLAKIHGGKMLQAFMIMSRKAKGRGECYGFGRRSRKYYGWAKKEAARVYASDFYKRLAEGKGPMDSPESRAKVSAALKGRVFSAETRARISATKTGVARSIASIEKQRLATKGRIFTEAHREAISAGLKGKRKTPAHVEKMRRNATGRPVSEETRAKSRERCLSKDDPAFFRGRTHSDITKARMAAVYQAKRVYQQLYGVSPKIVTIEMINAAGVPIV